MVEIPTPQQTYTDSYILESARYADVVFPRLLEGFIDPMNVHHVIDLCSGQGVLTSMAVRHFPNAVIHAVDFHDVLIPELKAHERVVFHQGLILDMLRDGGLPVADIAILVNTSNSHGFNEENMVHLAQKAKFVITYGDDGGLEKLKSFHTYFSLLRGNPFSIDDCLWGRNSEEILDVHAAPHQVHKTD